MLIGGYSNKADLWGKERNFGGLNPEKTLSFLSDRKLKSSLARYHVSGFSGYVGNSVYPLKFAMENLSK